MLYDNRFLSTGPGTIIAANASGGIQFQATGGARFTGGIDVIDGNWHQVTVTYGQSTNDMVSIYVDGTLDTAVANPGNWTWPTNLPIELGLSRDSYWKIYNGQMDDFRVYNQILTPTQIQQIVAGDDSAPVASNALTIRYNFSGDQALFGKSLTWTYGTLQSSPVLGAGAVWTTLTNAFSPRPILISPSTPAMFYRTAL